MNEWDIIVIDNEDWEVRKAGDGYWCEDEPCDNRADYELTAREGGSKIICLYHLQLLVPDWVE